MARQRAGSRVSRLVRRIRAEHQQQQQGEEQAATPGLGQPAVPCLYPLGCSRTARACGYCTTHCTCPSKGDSRL